MSYNTLLQSEESLRSEYIAILIPRRRLVDWTLESGFVYSVQYDLGDIESIEDGGEVMTSVSTTTPNAGEYYHDKTSGIIYLRSFQSSDPDTIQVVANYRIYISTIDAYWHTSPTDDSTEVVYWEPLIANSPQLKSTISDSLFGALPVQTSGIKLVNGDHFFERHLYRSSFNKGMIKIYHWIKELTTDNVKLVYDGLMSDVSYDTGTLSIKTSDRIDELSAEYRNDEDSFYNTSLFPNLDPNQIGKPIRYVYGYVKGFLPTNVDYVSESPGTSDNRDWSVVGEQTGLGEISRTVGGGVHTTTRTYVNFCEGFKVGDTVFLDGATDYHVEITNVSYTPAYIEHAAIGAPMANGEFVKKGFVSRIEILKNNISYLAYYGRDYTISNAMAGGCSGFIFSTSLESNLSMPDNLAPSDTVFCTVYGRLNDLTAGGPTFGAADPESNNISNPVMIIYDLLKRGIGIPESRINLTQFAAVRTATDGEGLGVSIPSTKNSRFPSYKSLILEILQSSLLKIFIDNDQKWTLSQLAPLSGVATSIDSDEIYQGSFGYDFLYADVISDVIVEYLRREASPTSTSESSSSVTAASEYARMVHKVDKQKTFKSLHFRESDAQILANRLIYALGDRKGEIKFSSTRKFLSTLIGDSIEVSREKLPDFHFISGTQRSVTAAVTDINKTLEKVSVTLDDQKGIEDNAGAW